MKTKTFSIKEAIKFGYVKTKENILFLISLNLFAFIIYYLISEFNNFFLNIIGILITTAISIVFIRAYLDLHDDKEIKAEELFLQYPLFLKYLLARILYQLFILLGLILFIVPGIIWGIEYSFFGHLIIDKKLNTLDALKKSSEITKGIKLELLLFFFILGAINLVGFVLFGVGLFVTIPTTSIATVFVYRKILSTKELNNKNNEIINN
jgi:uncharacterized membrane protein